MSAVELVEAAAPGSPGAATGAVTDGVGGAPPAGAGGARSASAGRRRRPVLVAVGVVVVLSLAVTAVVERRREMARAAVLARAPGVVDEVRAPGGADPGAIVRWRAPGRGAVLAVPGLLVTYGVGATGEGRPADGTRDPVPVPGGAVTAYDDRSGVLRWDVAIDGIGASGELTCVATAPGRAAATADPGPASGAVVACVAVPAVGKEAWGGLGRRGVVRVVVLDGATGDTVRDVPADRSDVHVTTLGADLVLTRTLPDGRVRVTREDARTGAVAWTFEGVTRAPGDRGPRPPTSSVERGLVVVDGGALTVLDSTGVQVDTWPAAMAGTGARVALAADDGSVPGLAFVTEPERRRPAPAAATLTAVDPRTGAARWGVEVTAEDVLTVAGSVVTADAQGRLSAWDAADGGALWERGPADWLGETGTSTLRGHPATDGRHVLVPVATSDGRVVLVAVDPVDGRVVWQVALPSDVREVQTVGRRLVGIGAREVVALGQD